MQTTSYRKKLIEVALPLKAINEASAREKSIRHGHPSTLHLWWARRPLAACRAVLFASLVDDPDSDPVYRKTDGAVDEDRAGLKRAELFNLIEELVKWENSNNTRVINAARAEIARCVASRKIELGELAKETVIFGKKKGEKHPKGAVSGEGITTWDVLTMKAKPEVVNAFLSEYAPPVLDPFCGGGSIPLEAQRLGLRAYASDLNPVPVLITKALIEIPPKFAGRPPVNLEWQRKSESEKAATVWQGAHGLAEDVRYYGRWMRDEAEKRIGHLFPKVEITEEMAKARPDLKQYVGQELTAIAWLWARTVASPNPAVKGAHVPLVKSFNISSRKESAASILPVIDKATNAIAFEVKNILGSQTRTIGRKGGKCLLTGDSIPFEYIRTEGKRGRLGLAPLAIVAAADDRRLYLSPMNRTSVEPRPDRIPDATMAHNPFSLRPPLYGLNSFSSLFTDRQLSALCTFSDLVVLARQMVIDAGNARSHKGSRKETPAEELDITAYADAVATYLGFAVSRGADYWSTGATWEPTGGFVGHTFTKQALPMVWDFCEANPLGDASGNWLGAIDWIARVIERSVDGQVGVVQQLDAAAQNANRPHGIVSTDPPYYNNVDYADLSDYFYVWLRRTLAQVYPSLFSTVLTPKSQELVATQYRFENDKEKAKVFFEGGLAAAFRASDDLQLRDFPMTVYYAFKQSEEEEESDEEGSLTATTPHASTGWETMLAGLIDSGFAITGTWPMRTERGARSMSINMNALASSIVLVCRQRPSDSPLATRKEFINTLRGELPVALKNLQHGNIAPVDLAQAAIGPGMAVFTRYTKIIESDGSTMTVRTALGIINQVLDEVLAEQEGDFDADTRWALAWFEQIGTAEGPFGIAETLSKAKNTGVNGLVEAGIVKSRGGKVQLLSRADLPTDWDPITDTRLRHWEIVQHLIRTLETKGETEAAKLLNRLGGMGETARELAYRLFSICERKKWADEALAYNSLVVAWPELSKLSLSTRMKQPEKQSELFS